MGPFATRAGSVSRRHPVGCVGSGLPEPCGAGLGLGEADFPGRPAMTALCSRARPYFLSPKVRPPPCLPHPGSGRLCRG